MAVSRIRKKKKPNNNCHCFLGNNNIKKNLFLIYLLLPPNPHFDKCVFAWRPKKTHETTSNSRTRECEVIISAYIYIYIYSSLN